MVDRGNGYPTQRDRDHWCYPGILWELDADLTAQPLCIVISASFRFRFSLRPQALVFRVFVNIYLPYIDVL